VELFAAFSSFALFSELLTSSHCLATAFLIAADAWKRVRKKPSGTDVDLLISAKANNQVKNIEVGEISRQ